MEKITIIGSGPSGYTAAIYASRANLKPLLITGKEVGGQLMTTTIIENFPGFPEGTPGPKLMMDMKKQAENFGTRFESDECTGIQPQDGYITVHLGSGKTIDSEAVIIATGASARVPDLPNVWELMSKGIHTCATCDGAFYRGKNVIVMGGGDSAMEEATFLAGLCEKVTILNRSENFRASAAMLERAQNTENIEIITNKTISAINGTEKMESIDVTDTVTNETETITPDGVFFAIGHIPNTDMVKEILNLDEAKYIALNHKGTETGIKGLFAAGDVHDHEYRQAITAAGYGCMAALDAQRYVQDIA